MNVHISVGTQCQQPFQFINIVLMQVIASYLKKQCIYVSVKKIFTQASLKIDI